MPVTPGQFAIAAEVWEWVKKASPTCLALVLCSIVAAYVYAGETFATKQSVEELRGAITRGFEAMGARMDLSDADNRVRDIQAQIRLKEREIADLEMVINEMENPASDSGNVLRNRAFAAKQDLAELQGRLTSAVQAQTEALRKYSQADR